MARAGALVGGHLGVLAVVRVAGAVELIGYAALAARRTVRPGVLTPAAGPGAGLRATLGTAAALTWLNPHVYLDTVVLLGTVAATHGAQRWPFGAGAAIGSLLRFTALGLGARLARPLFARPGAWRVLDALVAVVMGRGRGIAAAQHLSRDQVRCRRTCSSSCAPSWPCSAAAAPAETQPGPQ
ncbi:LysE family transporter [Rhodococcus antarcticus]|uniref:LysE family transporter n=1 Tax=Rhodococcus antarcticus TaxID=2987751 RepID=A0ABY6NZG7_9NOCA|nr:LysE family transporter [Rhodococcus antarcticus]UZJ24804.1 LysE family transporter [Rhodococcus antarcticus]